MDQGDGEEGGAVRGMPGIGTVGGAGGRRRGSWWKRRLGLEEGVVGCGAEITKHVSRQDGGEGGGRVCVGREGAYRDRGLRKRA